MLIVKVIYVDYTECAKINQYKPNLTQLKIHKLREWMHQ